MHPIKPIKVQELGDFDITEVRIKQPYKSPDEQRLQFKLRLGTCNELIVLQIEPCTICYRATKDVFDNIAFLVDLTDAGAAKMCALQKIIVGKLHRVTAGKEIVPIVRVNRMRLKNHEHCISMFDGAGRPIALTSFEPLATARAIIQVDHFWIVKGVCGFCCKLMQLQHIEQLVTRFQEPLFLGKQQVVAVAGAIELCPIYAKMLKMGVPKEAVRNRMMIEKLQDPSVLDSFVPPKTHVTPPPPPPPLPPPPPPKAQAQASVRPGFAPSVQDILDVRKGLKCVGKVYHSHYVPGAFSTQ